MPQNDPTRRLRALSAHAPRRADDVRALARFVANADCRLATVGFAARVDFDRLLQGTRFEAPSGPSPFALRRGDLFERRLREDGYGPLLGLLRARAQLGHTGPGAAVASPREGFAKTPRGMAAKARATEALIRRILAGEDGAPHLVDGAVLTRDIGGVTAYLEADAIVARLGVAPAPASRGARAGRLHVGQIASFPTVDGRADPGELGAALSEAAIHVLLLRDLVVRAGGEPDLVSTDVLLITPSSTGLRPTLTVEPVGRQVDHARRLLARVPGAAEIAGAIPAAAPGFRRIADRAAPDDARIAAASALADAAGTAYRPACLATCGLARLCRERAHAAGDPARVGAALVRLLPGVGSLDRVRKLALGDLARPGEQPVAEQLVRAAGLRARLAPEGRRA